MSKIIVAGAGHGGVVAAIKLAEAGHDVTIFEKSKEGCIGLPQSDVAEKSAFVQYRQKSLSKSNTDHSLKTAVL